MRMQKEEKIVVVLLLMALGSLAVAEWTFGSSDQSAVTGKSDSSISVEGHVLGMTTTKTGGNLVFHLDTTNNSIFVPSGSGAKDIQAGFTPETMSGSRERSLNSTGRRRSRWLGQQM